MLSFHNKIWIILVLGIFLLGMVAGTGAVANNTIINSVGGFKEDTSAPTLLVDNKLSVIYVGALYCPYCAMERWAFVMALSQYGNFTGLGNIISYEDNIATYDFINATYSSSTINLQTAEVYGNSLNNTLLQPMNSLQLQYYNKYAHQYIPFVCIGGKIFQTGAGVGFNTADFQGLTFTQIQDKLSSKNGTLYNEISSESKNIQVIINQLLTSNNTTNVPVSDITTYAASASPKSSSLPGFELVLFLSAIIVVVAFRKRNKV